jgi:hypothetical protein
MNHGTKFCRLCLKLLPPTILTSSLPFYPYQKDERALPGYLLTRWSFFPLRYRIKRLSLSPRCFLFFYSYRRYLAHCLLLPVISSLMTHDTALMMAGVRTSETSVCCNGTTQGCNLQDAEFLQRARLSFRSGFWLDIRSVLTHYNLFSRTRFRRQSHGSITVASVA